VRYASSTSSIDLGRNGGRDSRTEELLGGKQDHYVESIAPVRTTEGCYGWPYRKNRRRKDSTKLSSVEAAVSKMQAGRARTSTGGVSLACMARSAGREKEIRLEKRRCLGRKGPRVRPTDRGRLSSSRRRCRTQRRKSYARLTETMQDIQSRFGNGLEASRRRHRQCKGNV